MDELEEETQEYRDFVEKFKPKKTTDDCYTPPDVYEAVKAFAVKEYELEGMRIIRPFFPGGDYKKEDYSGNCVVIDNPPFSILSEICAWYDERQILYFLFAPSLTLFSTNGGRSNYIIADANITYENGAIVRTGFVTNMGRWKIHCAPDLGEAIKKAVEKAKKTVTLPKYAYPDEVATAATLQKITHYGVALKISGEECSFTRVLDRQKEVGKAIYGAGFLLSEKAAAEKAAAEKAAAEKAAAEKAAAEKAAAEKVNFRIWELSDREKEIIKELLKFP